MDSSEIFGLQTPIGELVIRGVVLYFGILVLFRILPRRTGGELAMMDLIFVILIAEAASHALGDYSTVTEGFVVILTLVSLNYLINFLSYRFPFVERLVSAPHLQIIKDGKLLRRNMRKEYLTEEELMEHLLKEGIASLSEVQSAYVESEGKITVIAKKK